MAGARLQTGFDAHPLGIARHRRSTVAIIAGTAEGVILFRLVGTDRGLDGGGLFLAGPGTTLEDETNRHEHQVDAESDHAVHQQVGNRPPRVVADLEQQVERRDGNGRGHFFLHRVNDGRAEQQHRHQQAQGFAQPAPHPAGDAHPHQQAAQSGKGEEAPSDQIAVLGHGVHGKAGKEALMITAFRPSGSYRLPVPIQYIVREPLMPLPANVSDAPIAHKAEGYDPYAWLQERDSAAVLDYLKAENRYQEAQTADQAGLRETLFEEIKNRILETDLSLPSPWGPYLYYTRTTESEEYSRHYRCPRPADDSLVLDESQEQLLLDPNELAKGGFFSLGAFSISPDHQRLAYSIDSTGDEIYTLFVKELSDGRVSELEFQDCDGSMTWANDSLTLFFGELDDTHRPHKLYRYRLDGTAAQEGFHENDGRFFLHSYRSSSERQLLVALG